MSEVRKNGKREVDMMGEWKEVESRLSIWRLQLLPEMTGVIGGRSISAEAEY
jgi:hypothetical protein